MPVRSAHCRDTSSSSLTAHPRNVLYPCVLKKRALAADFRRVGKDDAPRHGLVDAMLRHCRGDATNWEAWMT